MRADYVWEESYKAAILETDDNEAAKLPPYSKGSN